MRIVQQLLVSYATLTARKVENNTKKFLSSANKHKYIHTLVLRVHCDGEHWTMTEKWSKKFLFELVWVYAVNDDGGGITHRSALTHNFVYRTVRSSSSRSFRVVHAQPESRGGSSSGVRCELRMKKKVYASEQMDRRRECLPFSWIFAFITTATSCSFWDRRRLKFN